MKSDHRLLFGPLAAILLWGGILALPAMVPGYDSVRQTVSEIGEVGSPARIPFAVLLCAVAICLVVFAAAVRRASREAGRSVASAYLIAFMGLSAAGAGVFAFPHPLHNVFGLSELIGYQAPLALALTWRRHPTAKALVAFSWIMLALVWSAIAVNLGALARPGPIWAAVGPVYGLVQRSLFAAWFLWCAGVGVLLLQRERLSSPVAPSAA